MYSSHKRWRLTVGLAFFIVTALTLGGIAQEVHFLTPQEGDILRGVVKIQAQGVGFKDLEVLGYAVFEFSSDGERWQLIAVDPVSFDGFSTTWDTTKVPDGTYLLRMTITDLWNNTASSQIRVDVDNQRRLRSIQVPLDYPTIQEAIEHATPRSRIFVDAGGGPYSPFVVDVPGVHIRSVKGRAVIKGEWEWKEFTVLIKTNGVRLQGFHIEGGKGIGISGNENLLVDNIVTDAWVGIFISGLGGGGAWNTLERNTIEGNLEAGIILWFGARWNTLKDNTVTDNGIGVGLAMANDNILQSNLIADNYEAGIGTAFGRNNLIKGNIIERNGIGIDLIGGGENLIRGNEVRNNGIGIAAGFPEEFEEIFALLILFPERFVVGNVITRNNIRENLYGIKVRGEPEFLEMLMIEIDARENFWGDPSGPYHARLNPEGRGDEVSDYVNFKPWLTEPVEITKEARDF